MGSEMCIRDSLSTPEAEIVAAREGLKESLPMLQLWETMFNRKKMTVYLLEDNESAITVLSSGKNPTMRHMSRTQRISIAWIHERYISGDYVLINCHTDEMAADILTKSFSNKFKWDQNVKLLCMFSKDLKLLSGYVPKTVNSVPAAMKYDHHVVKNPDSKQKIRRIIEIATSLDSLIGSIGKQRNDCEVFRITIKEDLRKEQTVHDIVEWSTQPNTLLWFSLPCTAGSPWQNINKRKPVGFRKWKQHVRIFRQLWKSVETILDRTHKHKNKPIIAFEWPRNCSLWKEPCVRRVLDRYSLAVSYTHLTLPTKA